jgi:hypothetical protein
MPDPFETLFAFQRALEKRVSSDWLGGTTASTGAAGERLPTRRRSRRHRRAAGIKKEDLNIQVKENTIGVAGRRLTMWRM